MNDKTRSNASRKSASVKSTNSPQKRIMAIRASVSKGKGREASDMSMDSGSEAGDIVGDEEEGAEKIVGNEEEVMGAVTTSEWVASVALSRRESQEDTESPSSSQNVAQLLTSQRTPSASNVRSNPTIVVAASPSRVLEQFTSPRASSSSFAAGLAKLSTPVKGSPAGGPDYMRSPSGSELSSLGASPAAAPSRKRHRFTLEIPQTSSSGAALRARGSSITVESVKTVVEEEVVEEDDNPFKSDGSGDEAVVESSESDGEDSYAQARARATAKLALAASTSATTLTQTTIPPQSSASAATTDVVSPQEKFQPSRASRSAAPKASKAVASTSKAKIKVAEIITARNSIADIIKANERRAKKGMLTMEEAQELIDEDVGPLVPPFRVFRD